MNWCASFKTPWHVRREWSEAMGLSIFGSEQFNEALDAVCHRLDVNEGECVHGCAHLVPVSPMLRNQLEATCVPQILACTLAKI